jgi:hypothetical protein
LFIPIMLAFKRFGHRMEQRADQVWREALADPGAYMRSLTKLHEANLLPAVMPGTQTHPHLYDRLMAGGIQPDFPRPAAPLRAKALLAALLALLITALLEFMVVIGIGVAQRFASSLPAG